MDPHPKDELRSEKPDLQALAAFLPRLTDPMFEPGDWISPPKDSEGVMQMPYVNYSEAVDVFRKIANAGGWVLHDFDWPAWAGTEEAARLRDDPSALAMATPDQLARVLTVCIRQDRFVEGGLLAHFKSGLIRGVVQRAADIVGSADR